jgi:hypothetical protein
MAHPPPARCDDCRFVLVGHRKIPSILCRVVRQGTHRLNRAFSSEVETGSRKENAAKEKALALT